MCVVSMIMDYYGDEWGRRIHRPVWPVVPPPGPGLPYDPYPHMPPVPSGPPPVSPAEIEEFRRLLERAREYDKRHNEPDCELEEKRQKVRELAKQLGIDVSFIEQPATPNA